MTLPVVVILVLREAFRAVQRGVFDLDIVLENSVTRELKDIARTFREESETPNRQSSLKTLIKP